MKIRWFAHACFLLQTPGLRIITDPYVPEVMGYGRVTEPADVVIRSSADDAGHANSAMITGDPAIVTATEIPKQGISVRGLKILAIRALESLIYKGNPSINAMYRFALDGIQVGYLGDIGNRLTRRQLAALAGIEAMLVSSGGPPTINLRDLCEAIRCLRPRLVIPMHYGIPGGKVRHHPQCGWLDESCPVKRVGSLVKASRRARLVQGSELPALSIRFFLPADVAAHLFQFKPDRGNGVPASPEVLAGEIPFPAV